MALPPLQLLEPRLAPPWDMEVRTLGHEAFDAAEIFLEMLRLGPEVGAILTPSETVQLLGADPESTDDVMRLGWAVGALDQE